jgi:hypothetical protein
LHERANLEILNGVLTEFGYNFYLVREHDLVPRGSISGHPRLRDWLFTVRDDSALRALGLTLFQQS